MRVVGTMLDEKALPIQKCDFTGAVTIVMGAEDTGLRPITQSNVIKRFIFQWQVIYKV
jgi:23S rRNA (guanosine2251-2'-O)-methyltransferase